MKEVTVLYFASYREQAGVMAEKINITSDNTNLGELIKHICTIHPKIVAEPDKIVAAINEEYQEHNHVLKNGDTGALIPPVSGGSHDY